MVTLARKATLIRRATVFRVRGYGLSASSQSAWICMRANTGAGNIIDLAVTMRAPRHVHFGYPFTGYRV